MCGQTVDEFRFRQTIYKNSDRNYQELVRQMYMQQHLREHFSNEGHHSFSDDLSVTLINKTVLPNLLKQENYWRNTVKTVTPEGLNIEV